VAEAYAQHDAELPTRKSDWTDAELEEWFCRLRWLTDRNYNPVWVFTNEWDTFVAHYAPMEWFSETPDGDRLFYLPALLIYTFDGGLYDLDAAKKTTHKDRWYYALWVDYECPDMLQTPNWALLQDTTVYASVDADIHPLHLEHEVGDGLEHKGWMVLKASPSTRTVFAFDHACYRKFDTAESDGVAFHWDSELYHAPYYRRKLLSMVGLEQTYWEFIDAAVSAPFHQVNRWGALSALSCHVVFDPYRPQILCETWGAVVYDYRSKRWELYLNLEPLGYDTTESNPRLNSQLFYTIDKKLQEGRYILTFTLYDPKVPPEAFFFRVGFAEMLRGSGLYHAHITPDPDMAQYLLRKFGL